MNEISVPRSMAEPDFMSRTTPEDLSWRRPPDAATIVAGSGLFDAPWYLQRHPDVAAGGHKPAEHFLQQGWHESRWPNAYFDVDFYLGENLDVALGGINPLLHYIQHGEAAGRSPSGFFDPAWYAQRHGLAPGVSPLAHFLARRTTAEVSAIAEFDAAFYLAANPDVAAVGMDPFEHYRCRGFREGRDPSASFDTKYYAHRYLADHPDEIPLLHWRRHRHALALHTKMPEYEQAVFEHVRRFGRAGPEFEQVEKLPSSAVRHAKVLAYYLPQFHAVEENDRWWGHGFTEWTSIARGMPRFRGHYQPRIPRDLGHYDLSQGEAMRRQIAMARDAGVFGFVHYFYWFNSRRLLEKPLEAMLDDVSIDFPFCLMWANENWTRRWDGSDQEVLISQDYRKQDDAALLACFARYFADPRYIRINGRPVLMIYRAGLIPDTSATIARWRIMFAETHGEQPILVMAQSFGEDDPTKFGLDGAVEFPPHKLTQALALRNAEVQLFDSHMLGQIYDYDDVAAASLAECPPRFPLIKTVLPGWDNDARREGHGMALRGASPAKYQAWLAALVDRTAEHDFFGERIVCVNAWNEWAEGAYLEPDVHYGAAFLNATGRAVCRMADVASRERILLVGHDGFAAGAQMLLLQIGRTLLRNHGVAVEFLLLGDGSLASQYAELAPTQVVHDDASLMQAAAAARARGVISALVNSSASARAIAVLDRAGIASVLLVHELPRVLIAGNMLDAVRKGAALARRVIFPAACVRDAFPPLADLAPEQPRILPQGLYQTSPFDIAARTRLRAQLGMADGAVLIVGAGYGDLRKGVDLFLQAARAAQRRGIDVHFCWVGKLADQITEYAAPEIAAAEASGRVHFPGFSDDMAGWLSAADVFALTSREDPYPSVALEAMASGLRLVAFAGSGGIADSLQDTNGLTVPLADTEAMLDALLQLARPEDPAMRASRAARARAASDFSTYVGELLAELRPVAPRVSVAVLSHNYARYLPQRLGSIFAQNAALEEVIVLDDASTDDSVAVVQAVSQDWRRDIRLEVNRSNGGSVFRQWHRAAALARGSHLWIAEADDSADPELLSRLSRLVAAHPEIDIAFCDSCAVDGQGGPLMASYREYCGHASAGLLLESGIFDGRRFIECLAERNTILNVSSVVFRTEALRAALLRCARDLPSWRVAGDWRLYVDILLHGGGHVGYLATPLNTHRRHAKSATATLSDGATLREIGRMHATINAILPDDPGRSARQLGYRQHLAEKLMGAIKQQALPPHHVTAPALRLLGAAD